MKEKILALSLFIASMVALPYSHQLLVKHELASAPEVGEVAGVSTDSEVQEPPKTMLSWCQADHDQDRAIHQRELLQAYQEAIAVYQDVLKQYPDQKEAVDRLIASEYTRYTDKLSELESQNEEMSPSCLE